MGWVDEKALRFVLPVVDDGVIGGESLECLESFCEGVGIQEVVQLFSELLGMFLIIAFDGGRFEWSVHAFDLPIRPRRSWCCQAVLGLMFEADAGKDMRECIPICFAGGELDASVGEDRMDWIWYDRDQGAEALGRVHLCVLRMPLGIRELAGAVDRNEQRELPVRCSHVGHVEVDVTDRLRLELLRGRVFSLHRWQATAGMPLH